MNVNLRDVIAPCYYGVHNAVLQRKYSTFRLAGGRASGKTSYICAEVVNLIMKYPYACAIVFMKYQTNLKDGVFGEYVKALIRLGVDKYFKVNLSPMCITYLPTGQKILFRGLDDASKTKGITTGNPNMYFAIAHFEELDLFAGNEEINTALDSVVRGGDEFWCFQCYNPPQNRNNWCNIDSRKDIAGRLVWHTDYRMLPPEWLGKPFYEKLKMIRAQSEREYRWRYLGEATGTGGSVFENIRDIVITPDMLINFDNHYNGQDWGYYPDPAAFVRWHFDVATDSLYCVGESVKNKSTYADVAKDIIKNGWNDVYTILDSARGEEMLSAFQNEGILVQNMYKGRNGQLSREFGLQWMQTRKNIYIDKNLTPKTYEEFIGYEYQKNIKTGEILNKVITFNDHCIDASRYALSTYYQVYGDVS